ncbi:uncharacterized protein LOC126670484 [Mercurialis annua]|uniref:uncharacterized protein LOC126670484 n=1 Tax=Mercurialis annua TaxID=3986 RepID=UPI00215E205A|nr:uncharacterized protein LOC126670484 [Mercurialis annua]
MNQIPNQSQTDEALQSMIKESIHRFSTEYRKGTTDFSNFTSIFSRFLTNLPDPPLEIIWFYSGLTFHSAQLTTQNPSVLVTAKELFQLLVSCTSSCNAVKKIAVLAPVISELNNLVCIRKQCVQEIDILLEVIENYISICCCSLNFEDVSDFNFCCIDVVCIWVIDKISENSQFSEALRVFFPLVSDGIRKGIYNEGREVGIGYLAGIVMSEIFLLRLCLKFQLGVSGLKFEKVLRDLAFQMMSAFRSYYYIESILRMLLEPVLPVTTLLNSKDEVNLRQILYDLAIKINLFCLGPQKGIHLPDGRLKDLAIIWLFAADNGIRVLRETGDKTRVISYLQAFSESRLPSELINCITDMPGVRNKTSIPKVSTPLALIRWLLIVEDHGVKVFDNDASKIYAKTIISKSRIEYGFFINKLGGKSLVENSFSCGCRVDKEGDKVDGDLHMADSEGSMCFTTPGVSKAAATNEMRKRKEERKSEGDKQVKFLKCHRNDNSMTEKLSPLDDYDALSSGSEVDDLVSDDNMVCMEQ